MQNAQDRNVTADGAAGPEGTAAAPTHIALDYLWKVHGYTNEYIRFGDTKAALILAIITGLIAALFGAKVHEYASPTRLDWANAKAAATAFGVLTVLAFVFLLLAAVFIFLGIAPRLWADYKCDFLDWVRGKFEPHAAGPLAFINVANYTDANSYWATVQGMTPGQQAESVARHVHVLAKIADRKFKWIERGILVGYPGVLFACIVLFCG